MGRKRVVSGKGRRELLMVTGGAGLCMSFAGSPFVPPKHAQQHIALQLYTP